MLCVVISGVHLLYRDDSIQCWKHDFLDDVELDEQSADRYFFLLEDYAALRVTVM